MTTKNPKVSAYVPLSIKNRLTQFREERSLSESQAVIVILAEYFGLTELLERSPQPVSVGGVTLARMEKLEKELASFSELIAHRFQEFDKVVEKVNDSSVSYSVDQEKDLATELVNSLPDEPLSELPIDDVSQGQMSLPLEIDKSSSLNELPSEIKPIAGNKLSELRFGLAVDTVSGAKRNHKNSPEKFIEWTRDKDPDRIPWKFVESPFKGYVPAEELTNEQQSELLKWITKNIK